MVPSGWVGILNRQKHNKIKNVAKVKHNKSCLSMVPKRTLWAVDRHRLDIPV